MRGKNSRVTARDIALAGSLEKLITQLIDKVNVGNMEAKEHGAALLRSLTEQPKGLDGPQELENADLIGKAGAVKPLVALVVSGSPVGQSNACAALANIARGRPEYQAAILDAGGVAPIASALRLGGSQLQEMASDTMASLSELEVSRKSMIKMNVIPPLVALLDGAGDVAQVHVSITLAHLASGSTNGQDAIARAGAIPLLIAKLGSGKTQEAVAHALACLTQDHEVNQAEVARLGGVPKLVALLSVLNADTQAKAAAALAALASGKATDEKDMIAKAGGLRALLALVDSRYAHAQRSAINALAMLSIDHRENQDSIVSLGGIAPLVSLMNVGAAPPDVQAQAVLALTEISRNNIAHQTTVAGTGAVTMLVDLLRHSKSLIVEAEVSGVVWALSTDHEDNKVSIAAAGAIPELVAQLRSTAERAGESIVERAHTNAAHAIASLAFQTKANQAEATALLVGLLEDDTPGTKSRDRAADLLWRIVSENPGHEYVIARAGDLEGLVRLLDSTLPSAKSYALWGLSLSIDQDNQKIVAGAGGIEPLIGMLSATDSKVKEQSSCALRLLAQNNPDTQRAIADQGAIKPLIELLGGDATRSQEYAAAALSALACLPPNKAAIDQAGGIRPLVVVLRDASDSPMSKRHAAAALARLASDDNAVAHGEKQTQKRNGSEPAAESLLEDDEEREEENEKEVQHVAQHITHAAEKIADAGAIGPLVGLLDGRLGPEAQEEAAGALWALAAYSNNRMSISECHGIGPLVELLGSPNINARGHAERALVRLSIEMENRVLIIKRLVGMLQESPKAQEQAAAALSNLARESAGNRNSIREAGGIPRLLELLQSDSSKAKENSVSAISELSFKNPANQIAISEANGLPALVDIMAAASLNAKEPSAASLCVLTASAIWNLSDANPINQTRFAKAGAIPVVVVILQNLSAAMQLNAAGALASLARGHWDNQDAIARAGALAPLCTMVRDGAPETKDESAAALWALATDHAQNKAAIAKHGGIERFMTASRTQASSTNSAGALGALAKQNAENCNTIIKRIIMLVGIKGTPQRAVRLLNMVAEVCDNEPNCQLAMSKMDGIPPLVPWLENPSDEVQVQAARAVCAVVSNNKTTQTLIGQLENDMAVTSEPIKSLILLVQAGSLHVKENACSALWHLATLDDNRKQIEQKGGVAPLVHMLIADGDRALQLAAMTLLRLAEGSNQVSYVIAQSGGVEPLVRLLSTDNAEMQQVASALLAAIASVSKNRDRVINAGALPPLMKLITSRALGTPETAARVLGWLARNNSIDYDGDFVAKAPAVAKTAEPHEEVDSNQEAACTGEDNKRGEVGACSPATTSPSMTRSKSNADVHDTRNNKAVNKRVKEGGEQRRIYIKNAGGIELLISMLDGANLFGKGALEPNPLGGGWAALRVGVEDCQECTPIFPGSLVDLGMRMGMQEQAASTLSHLADSDSRMQEAIIEQEGIAPLLSLVRSGTQIAQEHAARAIWYLSTSVDNQRAVVEGGAIVDLVALLKQGTPMAQYVAAAGLGELAYGTIKARQGHAETKPRVKLETSNDSNVEEQLGTALGKNSVKLIDMFREWDSDGNGSVDKDEFFTAVTALGYEAPKKIVDRLFNRLDHRGVGEIEYFDLTEALRPYMQDAADDMVVEQQLATALSEHSERLIDMLREWDVDGNGTVDANEFYAAVTGLGHKVPRRAVDRLFKKLDESAAGEIEFNQLKAALKPYMQASTQDEVPPESRVSEASSTAPSLEEDRLKAINEAGGIAPLVRLSEQGTAEGKEKAAAAIWHLALDSSNQIALAASGAIKQLISLLSDGTQPSKRFASQALARLAIENPDNQGQIAKRLVALLDNDDSSVVSLAAMDLQALAHDHPGAPAVIVNAGAISPLVSVLSNGKTDFGRQQAAKTLHTLANSGSANQQAIAVGLVALLGAGTDQAQEYVTQLLLTLTSGGLDDDPESILLNRRAIAKAGPFKMLVMQLHSQSAKVRMLASAVLSQLAGDSESIRSNVNQISSSNGIPPLVALLSEPDEVTQKNATMVLADMTRTSKEHATTVVEENGLQPLLNLLSSSSNNLEMKAFVADTLGSIVVDHALLVGASGAIEPLVALLKTDSQHAQREAAHALAGIADGGKENQDGIKNAGGVEILVELMEANPDGSTNEHVQSGAAAALASLSYKNETNQMAITACGGINPLIKLVTDSSMDRPKIDAARTLWSLSDKNFANQTAIESAGGIAALIFLVRTAGAGGQESGSGAIASLALDNETNLAAISKMLIKDLADSNVTSITREKVARAISQFARAHPSNQDALALAGGITLVTSQLDPQSYHVSVGRRRKSDAFSEPAVDDGKHHLIQKELCCAIWSMAHDNTNNQTAIAGAGGIQLLITMLDDHPEVRRDAAGALWSLAADVENQRLVAEGGGIPKLVELLKYAKNNNAQDTAAGALESLASRPENRELIAAADGIALLIPLFEGTSAEAKEAAMGGLLWLAVGSLSNQYNIINKLVAMLANGPAEAKQALSGDQAEEMRPKVEAQGHATHLLYKMSKVKEEGASYAEAMQRTQVITQLVRQLRGGTEDTQELAQKALSNIARMTDKLRVQVTQQLVTLLGDKDAGVRQRAGTALRNNNTSETGEESKGEMRKAAMAVLSSGIAPLVDLLREGLSDNRVEAQEYSLRGLSNATDAVRRRQIVEEGGIPALIKALQNGKLREESKEHAAMVLASLSLDQANHEETIKYDGIVELVKLITAEHTTMGGKKEAALSLARLCTGGTETQELIADAGAIKPLVQWLNNAELGPPAVAALALADLARSNRRLQILIAEEMAIPHITAMLRFKDVASQRAACSAVASLARDIPDNQAAIAEAGGIPPLVTLLSSTSPPCQKEAANAVSTLAENPDIKMQILLAGGIPPLVKLLSSSDDATQCFSSIAIRLLAHECTEIQDAFASEKTSSALTELLSAESLLTQESAMGALLCLAAHPPSRTLIIIQLVGVLASRSTSAQLKAAEALAVLAKRSSMNRTSIMQAGAVKPLVELLGNGARSEKNTPPERAVVVLAELSRLKESKSDIVRLGSVQPLVVMLSSPWPASQGNAVSTLYNISLVAEHRPHLVGAGVIPRLVEMLSSGTNTARWHTASMLWELCASTDAKALIVQAGGIPALVALLEIESVNPDVAAKPGVVTDERMVEDERGTDEADMAASTRVLEPVTATLSELARSQSSNRMAIIRAGGLPLVVQLVCESSSVAVVQHATSILWGIAQESRAMRLKIAASSGAIEGLFELLSNGAAESQKLAVATLVLLCHDEPTRVQLLRVDAAAPLKLLKMKPDSWLRSQTEELMNMLEVNDPIAPGNASPPTSPRVMASRVHSNPSPMLDYSAPVVGMPMSPRAFGGTGKLVRTHSGASEVLLARFQAKIEVAWSSNPEKVWMLQRKKKDSAEYMQEVASRLKMDQRVLVETEEKATARKATIRYVGQVPEIAPGYWVGVEFDGPDGRNDGQINGVQYFKCANNHGSFLRPDRVKPAEAETDKGVVEGDRMTKRGTRGEAAKERPKLRLPSAKVDKDKARSPTARMGTPKRTPKTALDTAQAPASSPMAECSPPISAAAAATAAIAAVFEGASPSEAAHDAIAAFRGSDVTSKGTGDALKDDKVSMEDASPPAPAPLKRKEKNKQRSKRAPV